MKLQLTQFTSVDPFSKEALGAAGERASPFVYFAVEHEPGDGNLEAYGVPVLRSPEDQRLARHVLRKVLTAKGMNPNPTVFSYCLVGVRENESNAFEDQVLDLMPSVYCYSRASREAMRRRFLRAVG